VRVNYICIDETFDIISRDSRASHFSFRRPSFGSSRTYPWRIYSLTPSSTNNLGNLVATSAARNAIPPTSQARFSRLCDFAILLWRDEKLEKIGEEVRDKLQELPSFDWRYLSGHFRQSDRRYSSIVRFRREWLRIIDRIIMINVMRKILFR